MHIFLNPVTYIQVGNEQLVCKLKKSLYGLKQSPRCWNVVFNNYLKSIDFEQNTADPCVYIKKKADSLIILAVYVDDLIVIANTAEEMTKVKQNLTVWFKDEGYGKFTLLSWNYH